MGIAIVIPSYKRAGRVRTFAVIDEEEVILAVRAREEEAYREHYKKCYYLILPDDVYGISGTRQAIIDRYEDVFMLDDDITRFVEQMSIRKNRRMKSKEVIEVINATYELAVGFGVYLFGFKVNQAPYMYAGAKPFSLTGFVKGECIGVRRGGGLFFPGKEYGLSANDDKFVSLYNAFKNRRCLIDNRFSVMTANVFKGYGGNAEYRSEEKEKADYRKLRSLFGDAVRWGTAGNVRGGEKKFGRYHYRVVIPF